MSDRRHDVDTTTRLLLAALALSIAVAALAITTRPAHPQSLIEPLLGAQPAKAKQSRRAVYPRSAGRGVARRTKAARARPAARVRPPQARAAVPASSHPADATPIRPHVVRTISMPSFRSRWGEHDARAKP